MRIRAGRIVAGLGASVLAAGTALVGVPPAEAAEPAGGFSCHGTPIVDATARIVDEADGGVAGKVWSLINITERFQIWREAPTRFCVIETDVGKFRSFAGESPGGTGTIAANRRGITLGVQRFELDGTFHPVVPVSGSLGRFDFECDQQARCPGNVRFSQLFFTDITGTSGAVFAEVDISKRHGTWLQSGTTSLGDITG